MANSRIKDISTTATSAASDDYLVIDGATNGTRKIVASDIGGGGDTWYDFTTTITPSIVSGSTALYIITPTNTSDITAKNIARVKAVSIASSSRYILYPYYYKNTSSTFSLGVINMGTSTTSGTLHIIAPFQISSVSVTM